MNNEIKSTETIGLWVEKIICEISNIPFVTSRNYINEINFDIKDELMTTISSLLNDLSVKEHLGSLFNEHDFLLECGNHLSVKTNIANDKLCPNKVGQTSFKKINEKFEDINDFKKWIFESPDTVLNFYMKNLFISEYILYINFEKGFAFLVSSRDINIPNFLKENITFTRKLETFNESCTLKYNKKSIAEVQVHSSRNCVKFRFYMKNLSSLLNIKIYTFSKTKFKVKKNLGTFNYIGSKTNLLAFLKKQVESYIQRPIHTIEGFFDIFSGTAVVSSFFAENGCKSIITNDNMYYSYILSSSLTNKNVNIIKMKKEINFINEHLVGIDTGYIYNTYALDRMYFTKENAKKIDVILFYINSRIDFYTKEEYYLILKILLYACTKVANISSTYGAYLKKFKKSSLQPLKLSLNSLELLCKCSEVQVSSYCMNVIDFLNTVDTSGDVCYLDPPYNSRKYSSNYFILESIARNDKPIVSNGITGVPIEEPAGSSIFCSKITVRDAFSHLFSNIKSKYLFLSYNSESLLTKDEMISLLKEKWINIKVVETDYKRFKSNVNSGESTITEYLFCATNSSI